MKLKLWIIYNEDLFSHAGWPVLPPCEFRLVWSVEGPAFVLSTVSQLTLPAAQRVKSHTLSCLKLHDSKKVMADVEEDKKHKLLLHVRQKTRKNLKKITLSNYVSLFSKIASYLSCKAFGTSECHLQPLTNHTLVDFWWCWIISVLINQKLFSKSYPSELKNWNLSKRVFSLVNGCIVISITSGLFMQEATCMKKFMLITPLSNRETLVSFTLIPKVWPTYIDRMMRKRQVNQ